MQVKDPSAAPRKLGIFDFFAALAACAWLAILFFLYSRHPEVHFLIRVLAISPLALAGGAVCFLFLWRPLPKEDPNTISHEDFGVALRAKKIAALYITLPFLKRTARKEVVPAAITAGVLFLLGITPLGPFRGVKITYPDPSVLVARDILRPMMVLAGDSLAVLAPPTLSPQTESWEKIIPAKNAGTKIYRLIFQGKYSEAADLAGLTRSTGGPDAADPLVARGQAQALFLMGDYENALKHLSDLPPTSPEISLQIAVAHLYLGNLSTAEELMHSSTRPVMPVDFHGQDFITEHLLLLVNALRGKDLQKTGENLTKLWNTQRDLYIRSLYPEEAEETESKATAEKETAAVAQPGGEKTVSLLEAIRQAENRKGGISKEQLHASRLQKGDFLVVNNNHVVHLALQGSYAGAYREAELTKHLCQADFSEGTQRLAQLATASAWNTQGVMLACFEKHMPPETASAEDKKTKKTPEKSPQTAENAKMAENILKDSPLPLECFQHAESFLKKMAEAENSMLRTLLRNNQLLYYIRSEFPGPAIPTAEKFEKTAADILNAVRDENQKQRAKLDTGYDADKIPTWVLATQLSLMDYYMKVDGREKNSEAMLETVILVAPARLGPDSLTELDARSRFIEARLLDRFAKNSKMGSLKETEAMLRRTLETAKKTLPPNHPVLARLLTSSARMTLLQKSAEPAKKARPIIQEALAIYETLEIPEINQGKYLAKATDFLIQSLLVTEADESAGDAAKQNTLPGEMTAFRSQILANYGRDSLMMADWWRDRGFMYSVNDQDPASAAGAIREYEKAAEIYRNIFGENSKHFLLTGMQTFLSESKPAGATGKTPKTNNAGNNSAKPSGKK